MALDFLKSLVGGEESESYSTQDIYAPQAEFAESYYYPALTELFQGGAYTSPLEQQGIEGALQTATALQGGLIDPTQNALMQLFRAPEGTQQLVQSAIQGATAPLFEQFENVIAPEIRRSSGAAGQPGGSRGTIATRLAANDLMRQAGDIGSQIALQATLQDRQQGLDALKAGISMAPQVAGLSFMPSDVQRSLGADESAQEADFLAQIQALLGSPTILGTSTSSAEGTRGITQGIKDVFGGGTGAAAMFSDRRLKRNVRKIGTLGKLNLYSYTYLWGTFAIGVMADEVKALIPDAVIRHESGFDMVDYSKI